MSDKNIDPIKKVKIPAKYNYGTGKRKSSVVKTWIFNGKGNITINNKSLNEHFKSDCLVDNLLQPLKICEVFGKFDIALKSYGGGLVGQSDAARHGISKALEEFNPEFRKILKQAGFLTRDPRVKERKKYGRKKARKGYQYRKR